MDPSYHSFNIKDTGTHKLMKPTWPISVLAEAFRVLLPPPPPKVTLHWALQGYNSAVCHEYPLIHLSEE